MNGKDLMKSELEYLYYNQDLEISDIANLYHIKKSVIVNLFKKYNILTRKEKAQLEKEQLMQHYIHRASKLYGEGFCTMAQWSQMLEYIRAKFK